MKIQPLKFVLFITILLLLPRLSYAWWDNNWNHKVPMTINNTSATTVNNYEVKITINATNAPNFAWANNGNDIRFVDTDDLTLIPHFLEDYDAIAMTAIVWVSVPTIPAAGSHEINLYYDNAAAATGSDATSTFSQTGVKYHSRNSTFDPANQTSADSTFDATPDGVAGYGCTHFNDYTDKDNANTIAGGIGADIIYTTEFFFESTVATSWEFRFGGDSGNGGSISVDNTIIEELWDPPGTADDMWWSYSWANYTIDQDILYGTQSLGIGYHKMRYIGYEICCDGGATMQYSTNGGTTWQTFNIANISIVSAQCPVINVTSSFGPEETFDVAISFVHSELVDSTLIINWQSATESFNLGYNIWTQNKTGKWSQLNKYIIASKNINSLTPLNYSQKFDLTQEVIKFQISSIDTTGHEDFYKSYEPNKTFGSKSINQSINWNQVHQQNTQVQHKNYINKSASINSFIINITSNESGLMRIHHEDLLPLGINLNDYSNADIAISNKGQAIARNIQTAQNSGNKYIDFFVKNLTPHDALYISESVYQLSINPLLVKDLSININPNPLHQISSFYKSQKRDHNLTYSFASTYDDPWFETLLYNSGNGARYDLNFTLDENIDLQQVFLFNITLLGLTNFPGDAQLNPDHHLKVSVNNTEIYNNRRDGLVQWNFISEVSGQHLVNGPNTLSFELINDTGFAADLVYFDKFTLSYKKDLVANNDKVEFKNNTQNSLLQLSGFSHTDLIAYAESESGDLYQLTLPNTVSNPDILFENNFEQPQANVLTINGINSGTENHYWISSEHQLISPSNYEIVNSPQIKTNNASYLIIAHPNFINSDLENFKISKLNQGITTQIINFSEIVQQYGHGYHTPDALHLFLKDAYNQHPYNHVLLVGGQTYDYNDYLNNNAISFIPTNYRSTSTQINYAPTDFPFTDINNDSLPDFALGRWPVRSQQDLINIVNKTLQWQQTHPKSNNKTLLIAEQKDNNNTDFANQVNSIVTNLNLDEATLSRVFIDDYLAANNPDPIVNARTDIIQYANNGIDNIIFDGHGSPTSWAYQGIIKAQHISEFNNLNSPILLSPLSCYTTYYQSPSVNTLAHQWLFSTQSGAVAIHGAMVLGFYQSNQNMTENILEQMYNQNTTIGIAIMNSKRQLQSTDDLLVNWNLLGDPSLRF